MKALAIFLFALCLSTGTAKSAEIGAENRAQYLERLMSSIRSMPAAEFERLASESQSVFSELCRSSDPSLALSCSFEASEKICKSSLDNASCLLVMDAFIVERLNANRFVSVRERYEMMSRGSDFKARMAESLQFRYGTIVQAFSLGDAASCKAGDFTCLGKSLEKFCQNEAKQGRLSYQSCASVVALYIGRHSQGN